ncbi:MAG: Phosphohistidine phosphatase [uncultured Thiotrichaceae bacterium]|uniref:Phosphohistidine phosphatase n=1 Tax=uncultured Thiotrichaceae bacterium TaxID=298394 RepID=A0A6S6TN68_9GAMM|nr:MAG: Phosphohistidine phosphatase [uncultured Thiotrichaceae bacterium]
MQNVELPLKSLFLMRHAKSSWSSDAADDFSRPLNERGMRDAKWVAELFKKRDWRPERIVYSAAKRSTVTAECLGQTFTQAKEVISNEGLYFARMEQLLSVATETPESVSQLLLIGHNPGMEQLLIHLCPASEYQDNGKLLTTANVVHIGLTGTWSELSRDKGRCLEHVRPKSIGYLSQERYSTDPV